MAELTRFVVRREPFIWKGQEFARGDSLMINPNHPHIRALVEQSKKLAYDDREGEPTFIDREDPIERFRHGGVNAIQA